MIKKWGDSPAVRVPTAVMKDAALQVGDVVGVIGESGVITIHPVRRAAYSLAELLDGITPVNIHERPDSGDPVGNVLL